MAQLSLSLPSAIPTRRHPVGRELHRAPRDSRPAIPLALAAVLLMMALLVAPERPRDQEAICQRHNGEAACRVW
jgi:hypothetical protein